MRVLQVSAIAVPALALGMLIGYAARPSASMAAAPRQPKFSEKEVGSIPKAWGDLVGVTSYNTYTMLVFKDSNGALLAEGDRTLP